MKRRKYSGLYLFLVLTSPPSGARWLFGFSPLVFHLPHFVGFIYLSGLQNSNPQRLVWRN
jgi:hypothetical protein